MKDYCPNCTHKKTDHYYDGDPRMWIGSILNACKGAGYSTKNFKNGVSYTHPLCRCKESFI